MKKFFGWFFIVCNSAVFAIVFLQEFIISPETRNPENTPGYFALIALILLGIWLLHKDKHSSEGRLKKIEKQEKKYAQDVQKEKNQRTIFGYHMAGLPLSEGTECTVEILPARLKINGGGSTFNLDASKISDLAFKLETDIQKAYVSSIGGAVVGAALFGPLGAMVGGRAKEKKTISNTEYFIITYLKDGQIDYISLRVGFPSKRIKEEIEEFKRHIGGQQEIDL